MKDRRTKMQVASALRKVCPTTHLLVGCLVYFCKQDNLKYVNVKHFFLLVDI